MLNQAISFIEKEIEFETERVKTWKQLFIEKESVIGSKMKKATLAEIELVLKNHKQRLKDFQNIQKIFENTL